MTDWATTRLIITGPLDEVHKFRAHCIRTQRFCDLDEEEFDFESLLPMPPEIAATYDDHSIAASELAIEATGFPNGREWNRANWGTKWNASNLRILHARDDIFDFIFDTPSRGPEPVIHALAVRYPNLAGFAFTLERNSDWGFAGRIIAGELQGGRAEFGPELRLVVDQDKKYDDLIITRAFVLMNQRIFEIERRKAKDDIQTSDASEAACGINEPRIWVVRIGSPDRRDLDDVVAFHTRDAARVYWRDMLIEHLAGCIDDEEDRDEAEIMLELEDKSDTELEALWDECGLDFMTDFGSCPILGSAA